MTVKDAIGIVREFGLTRPMPGDWARLAAAVETLVVRLVEQQGELERDRPDGEWPRASRPRVIRGTFTGGRPDVDIEVGEDTSALPLVAQALARRVQEGETQMAHRGRVVEGPDEADE